MTDVDIDRIMQTWISLYDMYGVTVDIGNVSAQPKPGGYNFPILNAMEMPADTVNDTFKKVLSGYNIMAATGPIVRGDRQENGDCKSTTLTFSDLTSPNDRTSEEGSYVFWVKCDFKVREDQSFKRRPFDSRMTVEEAMLYHLYWFWKYNHRYLGYNYSGFNRCDGSGGRRGLRWDLQDIKVCLD